MILILIGVINLLKEILQGHLQNKQRKKEDFPLRIQQERKKLRKK